MLENSVPEEKAGGIFNVPITVAEAAREGWLMPRCKIDPSKICVGENLPTSMDKGEWCEERQRHYEIAEAMANGCREHPDPDKPKITMPCPECHAGRMIDQRHRNGTASRAKIQVVCNHCGWSGYRLE